MSNTNVDRHSQGNIPFSWENKPGVRKDGHEKVVGEERRKIVHDNSNVEEEKRKLPLPPPPCENSSKVNIGHHDIGLPLPPCAFQPPLRSLSRRSNSRRSKDGDDPFLMAYKECTKSNKKGTLIMKKTSFLGSCKHSCSVRDDNIVRVSNVPRSNSDIKRFEGIND